LLESGISTEHRRPAPAIPLRLRLRLRLDVVSQSRVSKESFRKW